MLWSEWNKEEIYDADGSYAHLELRFDEDLMNFLVSLILWVNKRFMEQASGFQQLPLQFKVFHQKWSTTMLDSPWKLDQSFAETENMRIPRWIAESSTELINKVFVDGD